MADETAGGPSSRPSSGAGAGGARAAGFIGAGLGVLYCVWTAMLRAEGCRELPEGLCTVGTWSDCREALCGSYGEVFGIPIGVVAAAWFAFAGALHWPATRRQLGEPWIVAVVSLAGLGAVALLAGIEVFSFRRVCAVCLIVKALVVQVAVASLIRARGHAWGWYRPASLSLAVVALGFGTGSTLRTPERRCHDDATRALVDDGWRDGDTASAESLRAAPGARALLFYETTCLHCCRFVNSVLEAPEVRAGLARVERVRVRASSNAVLAREYLVRGVPCLVLIDSRGRTLRFHGGELSPERLTEIAGRLE